MTAALRTVRLLDREPGKATESRVVHGVTVERGVPIPSPRIGVGAVVQALELGESFAYPIKIHVTYYNRASGGKRFVCKRVGPKLFRVWRSK
jgi:hypothetical protein